MAEQQNNNQAKPSINALSHNNNVQKGNNSRTNYKPKGNGEVQRIQNVSKEAYERCGEKGIGIN